MAWDFRPGMRVVCVDVSGGENIPLKLNGIYTISDIRLATFTNFITGIPRYGHALQVEEAGYLGPGGKPGWFNPRRFRPLDERRIDCFRAHLEPRNVEVAA